MNATYSNERRHTERRMSSTLQALKNSRPSDPYPMYEHPLDPDFGKRFYLAWRQSKHGAASQGDLATLFGVSRSAISAWVHGIRTHSNPSIKKIAREFEINPDWLYTGREPMRPSQETEYLHVAHQLMKFDLDTQKVMLFILGLIEKKMMTPEQIQQALMQSISSSLSE